MSGTGDSGEAVRAVTAWLPSGVAVKVEAVTDEASADGMTSVGLRHFEVADALESVGEIGALVVSRLGKARPSKTTVELRLGFAVESGKLTALWVGGKGEAALTVTLEWSGSDGGGPGGESGPGGTRVVQPDADAGGGGDGGSGGSGAGPGSSPGPGDGGDPAAGSADG
jgi:Trypsin-co-occurring domain 1